MKHRVSIQFWSALAMLVGGYALAVAGFIVPPTGEISDSVLWIFSQCLIYAGSIFGVSIYYGRKVHQMEGKIGEAIDKAIREEEAKLNNMPSASSVHSVPSQAKP